MESRAPRRKNRVRWPSRNFADTKRMAIYMNGALNTIPRKGQITFVIRREENASYTVVARLDLSMTEKAEKRRIQRRKDLALWVRAI